jgi:hypothetical protein
VTSRQPARIAARRSRSTPYGWRHGGALVGSALAAMLAHAALASRPRSRPAAARHLLTREGGALNEDRPDPPSVTWPLRLGTELMSTALTTHRRTHD